MTRLEPYADDAAAQTIGGLTIENGTRAIAIHGSLALARDRQGLAHARALKIVLEAVVAALERETLPDEAGAIAEATTPKANPFA
jgi:hypothetical protein